MFSIIMPDIYASWLDPQVGGVEEADQVGVFVACVKAHCAAYGLSVQLRQSELE